MASGLPRFTVVLKTDVAGSLEAIVDVLDSYSAQSQCHLELLDFGVGPPTESELELAEAFHGRVYTFNVATPPAVRADAERLGVQIRDFNVIYRLVADLKQQITAVLPTVPSEEILGTPSAFCRPELRSSSHTKL